MSLVRCVGLLLVYVMMTMSQLTIDLDDETSCDCGAWTDTEDYMYIRPSAAAVQAAPRLDEKRCLTSALIERCIPLLIQQNVDGSNFFNRSWEEFKVGFNDTSGNYWLGNELLSQLTTNRPYQLRFDLQSRRNGAWYYAKYSSFIVLGETFRFRLQVSGYSGNAGNDAFSVHNNMEFTTKDRDNDKWVETTKDDNCAVYYGGGFWHNNCGVCRVNVLRGRGYDFSWWGLPGGRELQSTRMWLQCP